MKSSLESLRAGNGKLGIALFLFVFLLISVIHLLYGDCSPAAARSSGAVSRQDDWEGAVLGKMDVRPSLKISFFQPDSTERMEIDAGSYIDIEYTWQVGENFVPPQKGARAFVHFRDSEGKIITDSLGRRFQDDHDIDPPPDQWVPGSTVSYTRTNIKVPKEVGKDNYPVTVTAGLYIPAGNRRAELNWPGGQPENLAYPVAEFQVVTREDRFPLDFEGCFYPEPPDYVWRWCKKSCAVLFRRDSRAEAVELVMAGHSPAEEIGGTQKMRIYVFEKNDEFLVKELIFNSERVDPTRIPIPDRFYNESEYVSAQIRFVFELEPAMTPGGGDKRKELGFKFSDLMLLPREPD